MYVCFLFLCLAVLLSKVTNVPGFHVIKLRNLVKLVSTTGSLASTRQKNLALGCRALYKFSTERQLV